MKSFDVFWEDARIWNKCGWNESCFPRLTWKMDVTAVCSCVQLCMLNTYVSWRVMHWWLVLTYAYLCVNWIQIGRKSWHRWVEASTTLVTLYHRMNWKSSWKHTMWVVILLNRVVSDALWKDFGMHFYCCEFFSILAPTALVPSLYLALRARAWLRMSQSYDLSDVDTTLLLFAAATVLAVS